MGDALLDQLVGGHESGPEQQRRPVPDQDVTDPAAVPAAPGGPEAVDLALADANGTTESTGLVADPPLARDHGCHQGDDDHEIDTEDQEKGDQHRSASGTVRSGATREAWRSPEPWSIPRIG